mmetsp:Transcript_14568/g.43342  ORF Transcript_14568/g.43342 Transcript_14568/m.43342 type:complete len:246 (+) Transcript_14568:906-1643(+)
MSSEGPESQSRVVTRPEGEEEVTPPYSSKTRSFDSLAVAHVMGGMAQEGEMPPPQLPSPPSSPTLAAAAAGLLDVQRMPSTSTDSAVDCLMSLSSAPKRQRDDDAADEEPKGKRPAAGQLQAARRRLKMRTAGVSSPLARPGNSMSAPAPRPPPIQLLSGATVEQLKLLAAAYKLCPVPTPDQLLAIAERVSIAPDALGVWFQSRKVLQEWVQQQPNMNIADLKNMFYGQANGAEAVPAAASSEA